jgi:hypothetical protein
MYKDKEKHKLECAGLNYTCPNEGCNFSQNMQTLEDLTKHIMACNFTQSVCDLCELQIDKQEEHNCINELKIALAMQRTLMDELRAEND